MLRRTNGRKKLLSWPKVENEIKNQKHREDNFEPNMLFHLSSTNTHVKCGDSTITTTGQVLCLPHFTCKRLSCRCHLSTLMKIVQLDGFEDLISNLFHIKASCSLSPFPLLEPIWLVPWSYHDEYTFDIPKVS